MRFFIFFIISFLPFSSLADDAFWPYSGVYGSGDYVDIVVVDNLVYLASENAGIDVLDISDPTSPVRAGHYQTQGAANEILLTSHGLVVMVRDGDTYRIDVLDLTQGPDPVRLYGLEIADTHVSNFAVSGDLLFLTTTVHLQSYRFDGGALVPLGSLPLPGGAQTGITATGSTVYVGRSQTTQIIDATVPDAMVNMGSLSHSDTITDYRVSNGKLFAAGNIFYVFDISNPLSPVFLGENDSFFFVQDMHVFGDQAWLVDFFGLNLVDFSDPSSIQFSEFIPTDQSDANLGASIGIAKSGNTLFWADGKVGMRVMNAANPTNVVQIGDFREIYSQVRYSFLKDRVAFVGMQHEYMVVDFSNPGMPILQRFTAYNGSPPTPTTLIGFNLWEHHLGVVLESVDEVGIRTSAFTVFDVSDPSDFGFTGSFRPEIGRIDDPIGHGNRAYIHHFGVKIFDTTSGLDQIGEYTPQNTGAMAANANFLFIVGANQLEMVNIVDPANPSLVGTLPQVDPVGDPLLVGDTLFLADAVNGLSIIDTSSGQLVQRGTLAGQGVSGLRVTYSGVGLFLVAAEGLAHVNTADLENPSVTMMEPLCDYQDMAGDGYQLVKIKDGTNRLNFVELDCDAIINLQLPDWNQDLNISDFVLLLNNFCP